MTAMLSAPKLTGTSAFGSITDHPYMQEPGKPPGMCCVDCGNAVAYHADSGDPRTFVVRGSAASSGKILIAISTRRMRIKHRVWIGAGMIASSGLSATVATVIAR